jgi:hypothetical protein
MMMIIMLRMRTKQRNKNIEKNTLNTRQQRNFDLTLLFLVETTFVLFLFLGFFSHISQTVTALKASTVDFATSDFNDFSFVVLVVP